MLKIAQGMWLICDDLRQEATVGGKERKPAPGTRSLLLSLKPTRNHIAGGLSKARLFYLIIKRRHLAGSNHIFHLLLILSLKQLLLLERGNKRGVARRGRIEKREGDMQ